ncbi:peptidoglycan-binding protein [Amylibacter sp.]|nr:peptidoglycan-binding protein [Amylibacter sp.]
MTDLDRAIKNSTKKKTTRSKSSTRNKKPSVPSAQRQENKQIQTALNFFDFPVGTADGALGRKSQQAISNYQAYMGFNISGDLDELEKRFLLGSYERAVSEGISTTQLAAQLPDGNRGLLKHYASETQFANGGTSTQPAIKPSNGTGV